MAVLMLVFMSGCTPVNSAQASATSQAQSVVLLHGLGRSPRAMARLATQFEDAGYRVHSLGYSSLGQSPTDILADLRAQLAQCCVATDAPLHFVGHSLGGLLIRAYLATDRPENLGRVVLLGTPNHGTVIVDRYRDSWWFPLLGPTAQALGTQNGSFPSTLPKPDYALGVIAGRKQTRHADLIPGDDDGLVAVASTRVEGMSDFLVVDVGHAGMRSDARVPEQTIAFLQQGRFMASPAAR